MTQREWVLALAAVVGVGVLPGCLHMPRSSGDSQTSEEPIPVAESGQTAEVPPSETRYERPSAYPVVPTRPTAVLADAANNPAIADAPPPPSPPPELAQANPPDTRQANAEPAEPRPPDPNWNAWRPTGSGTSEPLGIAQQQQAVQLYPPPDADPPVVAALRCLLEQRPEEAASRLQSLDKANQEALLRLLPLAARLSKGPLERASAGDRAVMVDQAESVAGPLRRQAPLAIDRMCFCRRIDKFGQFEPLPDNHAFRPGSELVQVYAELRNFSCDPGKAGYETRLASSVRLTRHLGDREETVWRQDFHDRDRVDQSRSPRRDYFNNYRFCIPENLPQGSYKLWLNVVDVPTGRSAESSLPLVVTDRAGS